MDENGDRLKKGNHVWYDDELYVIRDIYDETHGTRLTIRHVNGENEIECFDWETVIEHDPETPF